MTKVAEQKPVAYYSEELTEIRPGFSCRVLDVTHPVLGLLKMATTTQVIDVFASGFETLNTIYLKKKQVYQ